MANSERRRQKKLEDKARKRKEKRKKDLIRPMPSLPFREGRGSYEKEYQRVIRTAYKQHPSLLKIIECNDEEFYEMGTEMRLKHFDLEGYTEVALDTIGEIDFSKDPTTSEEGKVNEIWKRPEGYCVAGFTSVIQFNKERRTIVFMRKETGGNGDTNVKAATKLSALFHELGHVDDFEKQINYSERTLNLVEAEVYAHHFACRKLVEGDYKILLGYFLHSLNELAKSDSEYVKVAASRVIASPEFVGYQNAAIPYDTQTS